MWVRTALRYDIAVAVSFVLFRFRTLCAIDVYDFIT